MEYLVTIIFILLVIIGLMRATNNRNKEGLERKDRQIRHLRGRYNEDDRKRMKREQDMINYEIIVQDVSKNTSVHDEANIRLAKGIFKEKFGYDYKP